MLKEIVSAGFSGMDLWAAHLNPQWATSHHLEIAKDLLQKHNLKVTSLAIRLSDDIESFEKVATIAHALETKVIGGGCVSTLLREKRRDLVSALDTHDLYFAFENHPERTPEEVLEKIGDSEGGRIGIAVDTGRFGTQGFDAAEALKTLSDRLTHIHLKDIREPASDENIMADIRLANAGAVRTLKDVGHKTCTLGDGVVPIARCVAVLKEVGYRGSISIEHEPEDRNPIPDLKLSLARLQNWLKK